MIPSGDIQRSMYSGAKPPDCRGALHNTDYTLDQELPHRLRIQPTRKGGIASPRGSSLPFRSIPDDRAALVLRPIGEAEVVGADIGISGPNYGCGRKRRAASTIAWVAIWSPGLTPAPTRRSSKSPAGFRRPRSSRRECGSDRAPGRWPPRACVADLRPQTRLQSGHRRPYVCTEFGL
jgi:hypothetical protein